MNTAYKKALLVLAFALGSALLLTIAVRDEGLGGYVGNFGVLLVTPVAAVVGGVLFIRRRIVASAIFVGIGLFFIALLELTYVGLYLRHLSNIGHAKRLGEEIVLRLDSYENEHGSYPKDLTRALANWDSPYSWLIPTGPSWDRNVSIHYSSDAMSFTLLVCPPTSSELGVSLALPAPDISLSTLRPVAYPSAARKWGEVEMDACRIKIPGG